MKVIPKLQQGNTIESDNTKVVRPEIHEPIKAKPRQYSIVDLGGEPSNDTRSAAERNRDYWHPIKGAKARFRASMSNETNPLVGIERTILPSAAGAALVTTPAAVVVGALGNMTVDKLTGGWGNWLEDKTGIPSEIGVYTNPGAWYGGANQVRLIKQAALMDKVGRPFILQQSNPIWIEGKSVRNPELVTMAHGGRFDFKKSPLLKKQEEINGKRDMRKKFIKSSRPTYKKRIKKAQQGMRFVSYNPVSNPTIDYTDITNPINPFSEYNYNTTYDKPTALVVPVRDTDETDVVANNHTAEPVINKPVASKVTYTPKSYKGLAAFNKAYDEVEASNPEAKKYRQFLTKMAEQESGFNSAIQNRAGAPAYGYFQFMQDDKKYNNIRQYADTDIETFRNNPKLQIEAAIKLAKSFEKGFSKEDLELANKNGYSTWGLLGGAWLAGNGGVRKFLRGQGNPSDRHWSKEGKGTDVATRIKAFNFKEGGIVKYQEPAQPINRSAIRTDEDKNVPKRNRAIYSTFDATWNTPPWYVATAKAARAAYKQVANPDEMDYIVTDSVADAGWRKRLGLSYDSKFLPSNEDGSVRLPSYIEAEIPVDTTLLKDRIARETKIAESKNIMGKDWQLVTGLINLDKQNLDSLRKTYNTGEPTVLNEYSHNSRNLIKNGRLINGAHEYNTPLNILKNYTVQYDSKNRTMNYRDIYDFNGYEWAIPGKKFNIRGSINLDKK